jgi:exopolysaccharide production protein ExoZ
MTQPLQTPNNVKPLTNLQVLRAFAALSVVFFHVIGTARGYGLPVQWLAFLEGWKTLGVDLFFVISGFVMVYIQTTKPKSSFSFFKDRVLRIAPVYWLLNILLVLLMFAMPAVFNRGEVSLEQILCSFFFLSGSVDHQPPILSVGWTIEFEMLFYVLFAASLATQKMLISIVITVMAIIGIALFTPIDLIILEFIGGMMLGWLYFTFKPPKKLVQTLLIIGMSCIALSLFFKTSGISRVIVYGIPSVLIVFGCVFLRQVKPSFLTQIGDASYSIYLLQVFTIPTFYKLASKAHLSILSNDFLALDCFILSTVAGLVLYRYYELKISEYLKSRRANPRLESRGDQLAGLIYPKADSSNALGIDNPPLS